MKMIVRVLGFWAAAMGLLTMLMGALTIAAMGTGIIPFDGPPPLLWAMVAVFAVSTTMFAASVLIGIALDKDI